MFATKRSAARSSPRFRQAMSGVHIWVGVLAGWLLYAIFATGGISFFRDEISQWLRPELTARPTQLDSIKVGELALASMARLAPDNQQWQIVLPTIRSNVIEAAWQSTGDRERTFLSPMTGDPVNVRNTQAGEFFYYFHFSLHYLPRTLGRWIVGLCAMFGLIAIVTGVIVHKRIFIDFFTFRWGKGQRSWLDAHNAFSVFGLPFHLIILYTGLVTLMFMYMPWGKDAAYPDQHGANAIIEEMTVRLDPPSRSDVDVPLAELTPMMENAAKLWGIENLGRIIVNNPGKANAQVAITRGDTERVSISPQYILFDGVTGSVIKIKGTASNAGKSWALVYALHLGRFADSIGRFLYFFLSLTGAAMVATGMVLWEVKRRQKFKGSKPSFGLRFVGKGNVACVAGLIIAIATFFIANRLLPLDLPQRSDWEINCFFICWMFTALHAFLRPRLKAWSEQFTFAAILLMSLPLLNAITTERGLITSIGSGDSIFAGVDAVCILMATVLFLLVQRINKRGTVNHSKTTDDRRFR